MNLKKYFKELQRRHVVKAGLAYLVGAWLLVQVLDILLDAFQLGPGWMQTTIIVLSVGFPIWLIIAWVYDFSPEGIKKTEDVPFDPEVSRKKNVGLNRVIIGGLSIAVVLLLVNQVRMSQNVEEQLAEASLLPDFTSSIAVMAFEDMSPAKDQEWLSDGISIQILDRLGKYRDLKIINHRASFAYKGKDIAIDIIGQELDVAFVLDGSIQKVGDTFRTTVQLIDATDGSQVWSDTYDRKIEDALQVQDEIAQVVADRLNLTFTYEDVRQRKVDPEAFELYMKAYQEFEHLQREPMILADSLIQASLAIDSEYAPAWALFSGITFHQGFYYGQIPEEAAILLGLQAANRAIELDSANPVAMNWLSNWQWHARDGQASLKTLEELLEILPNSEAPHAYASHSFTRMGMPGRALEHAYTTREINPKNDDALLSIAFTEYYFENYEKVIPVYEAYLTSKQETNGNLEGAGADILAHIYYKSGDLAKAWSTLEREPAEYWRLVGKIKIKYEQGKTTEADQLVEKLKTFPEEEIKNTLWSDLNFELAHINALKGDKDKAFNFLNKAYDHLLVFTEYLWTYPEFKTLHSDPRWQELIDRLSKEFNFDYNKYME